MNRNKVIENIIKIANNLDNNGFYEEANTLTKIAIDLEDENFDEANTNPLDINMNDLDFEELFDSEKGRIVELRDDKGEGKADLGTPGNPMIVYFSYVPEKQYDIMNKTKRSKLNTGDIVVLSSPGSISEGYAALGIAGKSRTNTTFMSKKILE